jgi:AmiR/NasT family two-component response regulator
VPFADQGDRALIEETIAAGVSSYHLPGVPPFAVRSILRAAAAVFRGHRDARAAPAWEPDTIRRAMAIFIKDRSLPEPVADRPDRKHMMASGQEIVAIRGRAKENSGMRARQRLKTRKESAP